MRKLSLTLALILLPLLNAQTTPFTATGPLNLGPAGESKFNFTGGGTVTMAPGGTAQMKIDVTGTGDDSCNDNIEGTATITLANGDRLDLILYVPSTSGQTFPGTFVITGGTGQYAGKGGSGTASLALSTPPPNIALVITLTGSITAQPITTPSITPSGVVPVGHSRVMIQPGSWISVYGRNLATGTTIWDGKSTEIPTTLGGVTATINNKPAYFWFTSPGQINLQAPDDTFRGCATVTINTPNGPTSSKVQINSTAPSLSLLDTKYPAGVIITSNGSGAYGGGTYDLAGPVGRFPYATRPVKKGETIVLYGVGFGPTSPVVPAGQTFRGSAPIANANQVQVMINNNPVPNVYFGITAAGQYQINLVIPNNTPSGDVALKILAFNSAGGGQTQENVFLSVQ